MKDLSADKLHPGLLDPDCDLIVAVTRTDDPNWRQVTYINSSGNLIVTGAPIYECWLHGDYVEL